MEDELPEKEVEYEALAQSLVTEALEPFTKLVTPAALQEMHEYLVDELVCTSYGRAKLRKLATMPSVQASDELVRDDVKLSELKKKAQK